MLGSMRMKTTSVLVWVLLGLLIFGLAGFGISDMLRGGLSNSVATVGDEDVSRQAFGRAFQRELRGAPQTYGRAFTVAEAREAGLDRIVLSRLTRTAALRAEADRIALSVGRETIQAEIATLEPFQGAGGAFSADQARLVLQQLNITEAELEADTADGLVRSLIDRAVGGGARVPPVLLSTVLAYRGERRGFSHVTLAADRFGADVAPPTDAELEGWRTEQAAAFTRPETRVATYALLDPAALAETIEIADDAVRAAYDAQRARFETPARRDVARLTFPSTEDAAAARAGIEAGTTTLLALAQARGLTAANIDLGTITAEILPPEARRAVFAATGPGIVGPVDTDLGPALFQINAVLAPRTVSFEDAAPDLRRELAAQQARDAATRQAADIEDLVAGGASVEDIAREAGLATGTLALPRTGPAEGLAGEPEIAAALTDATAGETSDPVALPDGRYVILRLDEVRAPVLPPLADIRQAVETSLLQSRRVAATLVQAEALAASLRTGTPFARAALTLGLTPADQDPVTRDAPPDGLPADVLAAVFAAPVDGVVVVPGQTGVTVARVGGIFSFDPATPQNAAIAARGQAELDAALARDLAQYYAYAIETAAETRIDPAAIEAVVSQIR